MNEAPTSGSTPPLSPTSLAFSYQSRDRHTERLIEIHVKRKVLDSQIGSEKRDAKYT